MVEIIYDFGLEFAELFEFFEIDSPQYDTVLSQSPAVWYFGSQSPRSIVLREVTPYSAGSQLPRMVQMMKKMGVENLVGLSL